MRASKVVTYGIVFVLGVYAAIFIHAFNAFSTAALASSATLRGTIAEP